MTKMNETDLLDEEGYPTDETFEIIKTWHWSDPQGWFEFIEDLWAYSDFGYWKESESIDEVSGKPTKQYNISTAGWSGNESLIQAMQENQMLWFLNWVQSRRGGHYIFELKEFNDQ
jgi:hypothetical protein